MAVQKVPTGFIRARISVEQQDIAASAKFSIRNMRTNATTEQGVSTNAWYNIPAAPGTYAVYGVLGSVSSSAQAEVREGEITEEIDFSFGK